MADLEDSGTPNSADYNGTLEDLLEEEKTPDHPDMDQTDTLRALLEALEAEKKKNGGDDGDEDLAREEAQEEVYDYFLDA